MRIIDLTHTISENMPVYPGTEKPKLQTANTYEKDGFKETLLTMFSHTGTHMDAPAHLFGNRTSLDEFPASQFVGKALIINCTSLKEGQHITMDFINSVREKADNAEFLIFHTGWDARWGKDTYFGDYPSITEEVGAYIKNSNKKGVGLDVIGIDPISASTLPIHRQLLEKNELVIIENLTRLELVGYDLFTFCALPLKFQNSDGAPIRAIAIIEE